MKTSGNPSLLKIILLMLMFVSYSDTYVFSKPRGGQVVSGTASFTQDGNLTVITAGNRSVINYTGFDIAKGETVQFVQPSAHSTVLNRVTTDNPTNIFGTLQANGIVVIANPYGVFFQNGSVVNVGGLIAGAGNVSSADFTAKGKVHFTDLNGDVRNDGVIAADNRIALMGANVVNTGSMTVAHGAAMMVSGSDVYVGDKNGNIFVQANGKSLKAAASGGAGASVGSVSNSGTVAAPRVLLGAGDMYSTAIVNSGLLQGRSIAVNAGKHGSATVGGTLDATNAHTPTATGKGGKIDVLGGTIALKGATLDASGDTGGGNVRVGGDFHGDGTLAHATTTTADAATTIKADATGATGDGGTVVVWSDKATDFSGNISAKAGSTGGDGGQVEVSSHGGLGFNGRVDTTAAGGKMGSLLLDPTNIEISSTSGSATTGNEPATNSGNLVIAASSLEGLLGSTNVSLQATQDIRIDSLTQTFDATHLAGVQVANQLTFAAPVLGVGGSITFNAGSGSTTTGSFVMDPTNTIVTNGRPITITAAGAEGTSGSGGINTGTPFTGASAGVNVANFGILAGTINTSPSGSATGAGLVTLNTTVPTANTTTTSPVQATSIVTTSGISNGGNIIIGAGTGANLPTTINVTGALTTTATGARGGNIVVNGGGITTTNITTTGAGAAGVNGGGGNITLTSAGTLNVNGAITANSTGGGSTGGNVNLTAGGLIGVTGLIDTRVAAGAGTGGNVTILTNPTGTAGGDTLAAINTSTNGTGGAGNILIGTDGTTAFAPASLTLNGALTAIAIGTAGNGGAINLRANGAILANLTTTTISASSSAATGGAITVFNSSTGSNTLNGAVTSNGPTGGGNVTMDGSGPLTLASVSTSSTGAKGGNIALGLAAPFQSITINTGGTAASNALLATGTTGTAGAAAGGNVTLAAITTIGVTGTIDASAAGGAGDAGNGGTVTVLTNQSGTPGADTLGAITTSATGTGNAGSIFLGRNSTSIFAPASLMLNGALTAGAAGGGSGGTINLAAAGAISETSAINTSVLSGAGNSGNVTILTSPTGAAGGDTFGSITTSTAGTGSAGNILIGTNSTVAFAPASLTLNGALTATATGTAGAGGAIALVATGPIGGSSGALTASAAAGNGGNITATSSAGSVTLGALTSTAGGAGNGGTVTLTADGALTVGATNTSTSGTGVGGAVAFYSTATSAATATPFSLAGINTSSNSGVGGSITVGNQLAPTLGPTSLKLNGGFLTTGGAIDLETNNATGTITFIVAASPFRVGFTGDTTLVGSSLTISDGATNHPLNFDLASHNLTLNLSGGMTVDGAVGGTTGKFDNVNSFISTGTGVTTIDGNFSTRASQTYGSAYEILSTTATLQAGTSDATGGINLNAPLYDQTPGTDGLTLLSGASSGGIVISQAIGGTLSGTASPLASLTATTYTGGGTEKVTINGVSVITTGSQSYGTLTLGGAAGAQTTLTSTGGTGAISSGTVTGASHPLTVNTTGTGSSSTFAVINNAGAVDFEVGGIATFNGAITATSFTLGTTFVNPVAGTTRGVFNSGGTAVSTTGGQTYGEEVYVGATTTLADTTGAITFNKGVDSATATAQALTVNTGGVTVFGGAVGFINPLASLTTDAAGSTQINGTSVTTNAAAGQVYNDPVTLGANTTLTAGAGVVTFGQTLESAGTGTAQALAISTSGATTFGGRVGGPVGTETGALTNAPALASITTTGGGVVNVNGSSVTTVTTPPTIPAPLNGTQSYSGQVVIGQDTVFKGYSLTLSNGVTSGAQVGNPFNLTLDLFGASTLNSPGNLFNGIRDFASVGPGGISLGGNIVTNGSQSYRNGAVTIIANTVLTAGSTFATGSISLGSAVDDQTSGAHTLTLITGTSGGTTIGAAIGATHPLLSLTATARQTTAQTTTANQPVTINATSVTTTGTQAYGTLTLGGTGLTTLTGSGITSGAVTGNSNPLTVNATGSTNFGAITGAGALNFNVSGTATFASINDTASVTTTLGSAVFGPLTATGVSVSGGGTATFNGAVNAAGVSVTETGATAFNASVNASSLTVTGGTGVTLNAGTFTTTGEQNYNEPATLGSAETLSGQGTVANGGVAVRFGSTLSGPFRLVLNNVTGTGGASSDTIFGGTVNLASLSTSAIGTTQINGLSITTSDGTLGQVYNGATTLGATTLLAAGTGPINFTAAGSTLDSAGAARALTITTSGLTTFNAQVGGISPLASLMTSTGEVDIKAGVNTLTTLGGFQNYGGSVHLTGDTTLQGYSLGLNGGLLGQGNSLALNFTTRIGVPGGISGLNNFSTVGAGGALVSGTFLTGGTQTYSGGAVTLGGPSVLTSTNGSLIFNTPVDGAFGLTLNANGAGGQAVFNTNALVGNGTVGGIGAFASNTAGGTIFNMNAGGSTSGNGGLTAASVAIAGPVTFNEAGSTLTANTHPSILTSGNQTYTGPATLTLDTSLVSSGGGAIAFNAATATINSASATPRALNTGTSGAQTFTGLIGNTFALGGVTGLTTGPGPTTFNMVIPSTDPNVVAAGVRVAGPVITSGPVTFNVANSTVAQPSVLTLNGGAQTYGTLTNPATTVVTLAGPVTVLNSANTESPAGTFNGGGTITFNGNIVSTSGTQELDVRAGEGTAVFTAPISTMGNFAPGGASVVFNGSVGPLGTFTVLPNTDTGAGMVDLNINGAGVSVITGGFQLYNPPTVLTSNTTLQAGGNVTFVNTLDGDVLGGLTPHSLGITSGGTIEFRGQVGGLVPLLSLSTANLGAANARTLFDITLPTSLSGRLPGAANILNAVVINTSFADFETGPLAGNAPTILSGVTFNNVTGIGTQTYGAAVTVGTNTLLQDLATAGSITFNGKVDAKTDGGASLSVNAVGDESFNQLVGSTQRLSSLSTDAVGMVGGSTRFNMDLTQAGTVAGVQTTGAVNINDQVVFNANGGTTLPTILSGGAQTFQLAATLNTDAVLTATSGDITFFGAVDSASAAAPHALTVSTPGDEIFHGLVGYTTALSNLTTDATAGTVGGEAQFLMTRPSNAPGGSTAGGVNVKGNVTVNDGSYFQVGNTLNTTPFQPSVSSGGSQTYNGPATLSTQTILTSTGGSVAFNSTVDSETLAAPQNLTISTTAGQFTTFAQPVGNSFPLATLHTTGGGTVQINGGTAGGVTTIATANSQLYDNPVTLGQDAILRSTGTTDSIVFSSSLDGNHSLTVNGANTVSFAAVGNASPTSPLLNLTVTAPNGTTFNYTPSLVTAGNADVNIAGALAVNGPVFFNAAGEGNVAFVRTGVTVAGLTPIPTSGQDYFGAFTLAGTATFTDLRSGGITFHDVVNGVAAPGASNLTASTGGTIRFVGAVGTTTPLTSLTTSNLGLAGTGRTVIRGGSVTTAGAQTYNDAVFIDNTAATLTSNSAGDITFATTLDSLTASAQALTVNTSGQTIFGGAVGAMNALANLTTDNETPTDLGTQINGGSVKTVGAQTYNDTVTLGAAGQATTLTSTGNGDITFVRALDSNAAATPQALMVNTGGQTIFGGAVGAINALASVATDIAGATQINGGSVTTINTGAVGVTGAQTYNDAVTLGANTVLRSNVGGTATAGGALTFKGTVDGAFTLTLNTSGLTIFAEPVGNTTALTALTTNAAGATQFNMPVGTQAGVVVTGPVTINDPVTFNVAGASLLQPTILTLANGNQTYGGAVTLTASTYLVSAAVAGAGGVYSGGGGIFFNSGNGINGGSFGFFPIDLYVRAGAGDGTIAGSINAASVDVTGGLVNFAGPINISGTLSIASNDGSSGDLTFTGASVTTTTAQTYNSSLVLGANTTLTNAGENIIFNARVDGAFDLTVNSPGNETFNGQVGGRTPLLSLTTDAVGTVGGRVNFGFAGTTGSPSILTRNDQTYNDAAVVRVDTALASRTGNITFAQTVDGAAMPTPANARFALTLNAAGNETFNGRVGGITPLASLTTDDSSGKISGGQVVFNVVGGGQTVTTTGLQTYNDAVVLQADTNLTSISNGALTFGSTINGAFALSLNTTGVTKFGGAVGTNSALTSLTTLTGEVDINGGAITTSGVQSYGGPVALGADTTLTSTAAAGGLIFSSTLNSSPAAASPFALTISSVGPTKFLGAVGGSVSLASLTTQGAGVVQINGGAVTTTGVQKYSGAVTLGADTTLTSTAATGGGITFVSTLGSDAAATPRALTVNSMGPTKFGMAVGGNSLPLASLTTVQAAGQVQINGGAVTTVGVQSYGGPVTLLTDTTLTSTAKIAQAIIFNATVDSDAKSPASGSALTLTANGDEVFGGFVGGMAPLAALTTANLGRVVFGIGGPITVTTTGAQNYGNVAILQADTTLVSTGGGNMTFVSKVDSAADTNHALTLNTKGDEIFSASVGSGQGTALSSLATDTDPRYAGGTVYFGLLSTSDKSMFSVTTTGAQTYNDAVVLRDNLTFTSTNPTGDNALTFGSTVNIGKAKGTPDYTLKLSSPGDIVFVGQVGAKGPLGSLSANAAGTTRFENNVTVLDTIEVNEAVAFNTADGSAITIQSGGKQSYDGAATVAADTVLTAGDSNNAQTIAFGATIDGKGTPNGSLTLNSNTASFKGDIGATTALNSLTVNSGGGITFLKGSMVRTTGTQNYVGPVTLGADMTLTSTDATDGGITFASTLGSDSAATPRALTVNSVGLTKFEGEVGGNSLPLASLVTEGSGAVELAGANVTTSGLQNYGGSLTITAPGSSDDSNRTVLMSTGAGSNDGIIFMQKVEAQAGSLVVMGNRILAARNSTIAADAGDLVLDARDRLVLQGSSYTALGSLVLNDTYKDIGYANINLKDPASQKFSTIYVLNSGQPTTIFRGGSFDMGYLQNLFALGSVAITATGGGNATLSDISTVGSLSVTAGTITLRARDPNPYRGDSSGDDGLNFVAGGTINFGQSPISYNSSSSTNDHANLVTSAGQVTVNRNQTNGVSLFQDPTVRTRLAQAQEDKFPDGFSTLGSFGSFIQLTSSGSKTQEIAAALSGALPDQKPGTDVSDNLTVTASQMEELKKLGIHPRVAQKQERLSLNSKRALFAQLVDGLDTDNYGRLQPVKGGISRLVPSDYVVVVDRMSEREVQSILTAFEELYGKNKEKAPPIGEAFNAAFTDYSTEKQTADPAGFAPYLASKPGKYPDVDKAVRGFDNLFGYIESLGLTPKEQQKSKEHIASDLQVSGVSSEDMVKVIDTLRAKIPKEQKAPSTKLPPSPPASNPAPGATNPPPPEQKKGTPPLKTASQGRRDSGRKTARRQHQPAATEDRLHEVADL